ncbi:TetR/AcrR family transcriptional regulator [Bradyrhizobium sp.]|jgi:AcrR family transcriptional regulator|uniref:TetR/AcrR family transcriptional regulator n=1 Tax=Bradyrhizobium sp. TaxID=376 RepID=UPI003D1261DC
MKRIKRPYVMTARAAKAEATRARILTAAMELYTGRSIEDFTLDEVAALSETTVQTVLRVFGSKDQLIYAALGELAARGMSLKPTPPGDVAAAVTAIFDVYETMGDLVIQYLNDERRRPSLQPILQQGRENHRDWVKSVFAPLLKLQNGGGRAQLLNILDVATDVYVWKLLRRDQALGRPAAEAIMRRLINGASNAEVADGKDPLAQLVGRRQPAS